MTENGFFCMGCIDVLKVLKLAMNMLCAILRALVLCTLDKQATARPIVLVLKSDLLLHFTSLDPIIINVLTKTGLSSKSAGEGTR